MKKKLSGFTLIELLIVVAIIAILAAIAVPNFLEAQTRAKVSRVKSDMRTLATGIESYHVDNNKYPFDFAEDVFFPYYLHIGISTPIAYVSNGARIEDLFSINQQIAANNRIRFRFRFRNFIDGWMSSDLAVPNPPNFNLHSIDSPGEQRAREVLGGWVLYSKGPDGSTLPLPQGFSDGNQPNDWLWLLYDPTNGTISAGQVVRSQASGDQNEVGYGGYNPTY